jgi:hypothetical protein
MAILLDNTGARGTCFGQIEVAARAARTYTRLLVRLTVATVKLVQEKPDRKVTRANLRHLTTFLYQISALRALIVNVDALSAAYSLVLTFVFLFICFI